MPDPVPTAFLRVLTDLTEWFLDAQLSAMVIGGVAASILGRPRATRDIEGLLDAHPDANVTAVVGWVREFSNAMTMPDLLTGLEKLLADRKPKGK